MAEGYKSYRIRTKVGQDAPNVVNVQLDQTYDAFEILSLKIDQTNSYNLYESDKGVVVGRVLANGGFGVPNARVSIFIPADDTMSLRQRLMYPYTSVNDANSDRVRYNLLPDYVDSACHQDVGTFPNKRLVLDNNDMIEIFDKYWKYTTVTNQAGDYMLSGIPTGQQSLHMDVDLSDIGVLSQRPTDLVFKGYNINQFDSPTKFKSDTNLNSLSQIKSQDIGVYVYPFWGDSTDNPDNIAVTRCDIQIDYKFEPTCVFIGSIMTDTGSNAIGKHCGPADNIGKMSDLVTGEGSIQMIRKTIDNKVEEFQIMGNRVIDGDGVWCYQIPMNLDYVMTDEFGNMVPTDNPDKGIPTRTRVRFRISLDGPKTDNSARNRCMYLVPNNPRMDAERFPEFTSDLAHEPDYEFGTNTKEESYCDLFWNKVYSVKNYVPRIQKNKKVTNRKHTGIKLVNHYGSNNPMPYNNLSIKLSFSYRFICVLTKVFLLLVDFLNNIITILGAIPCKLAELFRAIAKPFNFKLPGGFRPLGVIANIFLTTADLIYKMVPSCIAISSEFCDAGTTHSYTFYPGCGKRGLASVLGDFAECVWDKTWRQHAKDEKDKIENGEMSEDETTEPKNEKGELENCVETALAEDNDATSFNFQNDWINGVLYSPLWFRKIKPKKRYLFGLIKRKAKDDWCSADRVYNGSVMLYNPCGVARDKSEEDNYTNHNGKEITPRYVKNGNCKKDKDGNPTKCHENTTDVGLMYGLIVQKETMLGEPAYYYRPVEYKKNELKLMFATDIILLGSLNDCDLNGVPQFFKSLESTTYKLPPNVLYTDNDVEFTFTADGQMVTGTKQTSMTEMTGCDWGNNNGDMCGRPDSGLFYALGCSKIEMMPKSCVNLSRICEFGVSLDETKQIPNLSNPSKLKNGDDSAYETLIPDGFISKDELYNDDERSMFATMNGNELKTKLNPENGLKEYDFRHLYVNNFDNSLYQLMETRQKGCVGKTYAYNYKLEKFSADYYDFRMGKEPYYYDEQARFPRYENSFYFYFGLIPGKTAIDKFNSKFFAECYDSGDAVSPIGVSVQANTWCSDGTPDADSFIKLDFSNIALPCKIVIQDLNDASAGGQYVIESNEHEKIIIGQHEKGAEAKDEYTYVGGMQGGELKSVTFSYKDLDPTSGEFINKTETFEVGNNLCESIAFINEQEERIDNDYSKYGKVTVTRGYDTTKPVNVIKNGEYMITVTDNDGEIYTVKADMLMPSLLFDTYVTNFKTAENILLEQYGTYVDIAKEGVPTPFTEIDEESTREIGGTIMIHGIVDGRDNNLLNDVTITIESVNDIDGFGGKFIATYPDNEYLIAKDEVADTDTFYLFSVPKGDEDYVVTVAQNCKCKMNDGKNRLSMTLTVGNPTPFKLYINSTIDYDLISHWKSGYTLVNDNGTIKIGDFNAEGTTKDGDKDRNWEWLNISDKANYNWDKSDMYADRVKRINDAIRTLGLYGVELSFKDEKNNTIIVNENSIKNGVVDIDTVKTVTSPYAGNDEYGSYASTIVTLCDEINAYMDSVISEMKSTFWITCQEQEKNIFLSSTTDDKPVTYNVAYREEEYLSEENYNILLKYDDNEMSYKNDTFSLDGNMIPSITLKSSKNYGGEENDEIVGDIVVATDNRSGRGRKYPLFVSVENKAGMTLPIGVTSNNNVSEYFGLHLIDKIFDMGFVAWSVFTHEVDTIEGGDKGIPYYNPPSIITGEEGLLRDGLYINMNGVFASRVLNGVTPFNTLQLGNEDLLYDRVNSEDAMPTKGFLYDAKGDTPFKKYGVYEGKKDEPPHKEYVTISGSDLDLRVVDNSWCEYYDTVYPNFKVRLSKLSVHDCRDSKNSEFGVTSNEEGMFYVYDVNGTEYPLNAVVNNTLDMNDPLAATFKYDTVFKGEETTAKLKSQIVITSDDDDEEEITTDTERGYGNTGMFEASDEDNGFTGTFYVIVETANHCRTISPVYDYESEIITKVSAQRIDTKYIDEVTHEIKTSQVYDGWYRCYVVRNNSYYLKNYPYKRDFVGTDGRHLATEIEKGGDDEGEMFTDVEKELDLTIVTDITGLRHITRQEDGEDEVSYTISYGIINDDGVPEVTEIVMETYHSGDTFTLKDEDGVEYWYEIDYPDEKYKGGDEYDVQDKSLIFIAKYKEPEPEEETGND